MTANETDRLTEAVIEHGNQLANNLVYLKKFMESLQQGQHQFLAEQRAASDKAQLKMLCIAIFSAVATAFAAVAAMAQVYVVITSGGAPDHYENERARAAARPAIAAPATNP